MKLFDSVGKKFLVPTISLLVVLLGGLGTFLVGKNRDFAESMMSARGEAMANFMEQVGHGQVAYYNLKEIDVMIDQALKDPDIAFAAFYDEKGKLMTQKAASPEEPKDDGTLLKYAREFKDPDGRAQGSMKLYYSRRTLVDNTRRGFLYVAVGVGVTLLLSGLGLGLVARAVVQPIQDLTRAAREVVRSGDLRQTIKVTSSDEIGQLAATFAEMVGKLRDMLASLQSSSGMLDSSVSKLSLATLEQGETLSKQSAALQETQTTAQEIKQTSMLAAQKADQVLEVMARADQISQAGELAVEQSVAGLGEIRDRVQEISSRIVQLNERAQQIAGITNTVKDLADQSNMLALNAAIEAVRSGEHGKGFAVVAREIRTLADQSIRATERVREILNDIGTAIRDAVSITQTGTQKIESGLVQVKSSGESLRQLSAIVKENSSAARQIASAVSQQNAGIGQIFTAMSDLSSLMEDTMKRLDSTTAASATVSEVSRLSSTIVKNYTV